MGLFDKGDVVVCIDNAQHGAAGNISALLTIGKEYVVEATTHSHIFIKTEDFLPLAGTNVLMFKSNRFRLASKAEECTYYDSEVI